MKTVLPFFMLALGGVVAGCFNPAVTRLPTLEPSHPAIEKRSLERHDPFPNDRLGPATQVRPRAFEEPRTEPRKNLEEDILQGRIRAGGVPQGTRNPQYPGVVR